MADLSIATLGALRITFEGEPILGFRTDKERALLVYLAVETGRPHRREALAGLFWPEFPEPNARHTLSQALTDLRHVLGDRERTTPYLEATRATVALSAAYQPWVDVREFDSLLRRDPTDRRRAPAPPGLPRWESGEDGLERLAQAVSLYQGRFLSGFSLGDAPAFEEWQLLQRERLHRQVTEAVAQLVERHLAEGDYEAALRFAWRQVELDPWREAAQRQLVRSLALTGQRGAALRQYEICCTILEDELGVKPDEQTRSLIEAVRTGSLLGAKEGVDEPTSVRVAGVRRVQDVPTPIMPLIGREAEMVLLDGRLQDPNVRLLTLVGPGGIGKTRLALELTAVHAPRFVDGAYVVPLVATTSWDGCVSAIAQAIGLVASEQSGSVEQQLQRYLKGKTMLLILDNVEQLTRYAAHIVELLESAPHLSIIATSRARLGVLSEVAFMVDALEVPEDDALPLERLAEIGSVKLFVKSAQRVAHDFRLADEYASAVVGICRHVEGMPLALLLAAAWADVLSPREILERLTGGVAELGDQPLDFLSAVWPDVPARQRSMRAVFDHSWRLMRIREQALMQALSVFRGGFAAEAAYFVVGATLAEIRRLVAQSLVARASGSRYGIHELLRQYGEERLARTPVAEREARDRHAAYYVHILHRWFEEAKGPRQVAALAEMDTEIDNAQAAWDWIVGQGDLAQIAQALDGLGLYYVRRVRRAEAVRACQAALERLDGWRMREGVEDAERLRVIAKLLIWQSEAQTGADADASVDRALSILRSPGLSSTDARVELGMALRRKGNLSWNTDRTRAMALYEESLAVLRETGDRWEEGRTLDRLTDLALLLPDFDAARRYAEELLASGRARGDLHATAWGLHGLSGLTLYQGHLEQSIKLAEQTLAVRREIGSPLEIVVGLQYLGTRWLLAGRLESAMPLYEEAAQIMDRLGLPAPYPKGVQAWGLMLNGKYDEGRELAGRALQDAHFTGERRLIAWTEHVRGSLALVDGDVDTAIVKLSQSVDEFRALREGIYLGMIHSFLGYAYRVRGDRDRARTCLVEELQIGVKIGAPPILACALPGMAMFYADAGRAKRAHALITVVTQCCLFVAGSQWFLDVAGADYQAAMDALSAEQIEEAKQAVLLSDMRTEALAVLAEVEAGTAP